MKQYEKHEALHIYNFVRDKKKVELEGVNFLW